MEIYITGIAANKFYCVLHSINKKIIKTYFMIINFAEVRGEVVFLQKSI